MTLVLKGGLDVVKMYHITKNVNSFKSYSPNRQTDTMKTLPAIIHGR